MEHDFLKPTLRPHPRLLPLPARGQSMSLSMLRCALWPSPASNLTRLNLSLDHDPYHFQRPSFSLPPPLSFSLSITVSHTAISTIHARIFITTTLTMTILTTSILTFHCYLQQNSSMSTKSWSETGTSVHHPNEAMPLKFHHHSHSHCWYYYRVLARHSTKGKLILLSAQSSCIAGQKLRPATHLGERHQKTLRLAIILE